jgi:hypothetical protein
MQDSLEITCIKVTKQYRDDVNSISEVFKLEFMEPGKKTLE